VSDHQVRTNFYDFGAIGVIDGYEKITIFGDNEDIDTATVPETIWEKGGAYTWPTSATQVDVTSTSTNDTNGGSGARTLLIQGLNSDFEKISETIILEGTDTVTTTKSFLRLNKVVVLTAGSNGTNAGDIEGVPTGGGNTCFFVSTGTGLSHHGFYTVPKDHTLVIKNVVLTAGKTQSALVEINLYVRNNAVDDAAWINPNHADISSDAGPAIIPIGDSGISIAEKVDLELQVSSSSANNVEVTSVLHCWLIKNNKL
jgi:hypothetical protein